MKKITKPFIKKVGTYCQNQTTRAVPQLKIRETI